MQTDSTNWQENAKGDFNRIKGGSPSSYWSSGLQRRLDKIASVVDLKNKKILDVGCGLGEFMKQFSKFSNDVYGIEPDAEKVILGSREVKNIAKSQAEKMPFEDGFFDIVFLHEVIEHVDDDQKTIVECMRVLKKGGVLINFCPNRLFPFETHGIYVRNEYYFGNIPLVTYLPYLYKYLTPHVRNYTNNALIDLYEKSNYKYEIITHTHIFPGFDGLSRRSKLLGKISKKLLYFLETTSLHYFGISHMLIVKKG